MMHERKNKRMQVSPEKMRPAKSSHRYLKIRTRYKRGTSPAEQIPEIVLKGDWLKELGFSCGRIVRITKTETGLSLVAAESFLKIR